MALLLLLTTDPGLHHELNTGFSSLANPPTLIQVGSWEELASCRSSVRDVSGAIFDTRLFSEPDDFDLPAFSVGDTLHSALKYPVLKFPLCAIELQRLYHEIFVACSMIPETANNSCGEEAEFIQRLIKEVAHDLNNQFTTLRGHIPLLIESCPQESETLREMLDASERATRLIHLLEGVNSDTLPLPQTFKLPDLIKRFLKFAKKIQGCSIEAELRESDRDIQIQGDPELICFGLLQIAWNCSDKNAGLKITCNLSKNEKLELVLKPISPLPGSEPLATRLDYLKTTSCLRNLEVKVSEQDITFILPVPSKP